MYYISDTCVFINILCYCNASSCNVYFKGDYAPELGNFSPEEGTSSDVPSPVNTSPVPPATTTSAHSPQSDEPQVELSSEPLASADQGVLMFLLLILMCYCFCSQLSSYVCLCKMS